MSNFTKDIFISYSRLDNKKNNISNFLESLWDSMQHHVGRVPPFFLDTTDIHTGEEWESKLLQTVDTCRLLIAFLSPSYFRSSYCIKEWKRMYRRDSTAIFPVTLIPYQPTDTPLQLGKELNAEQTKVFDQANKIQNFKWFSIKENLQAEELKKFSFLIHNKLIQETDLKEQLPRDNHHIIDEYIEENLNDKKKERITKEILSVNQKRKYNHEPVCVIYTGGTIGMVYDEKEKDQNKNILKQGSVIEFIENIYKLEHLEVDIDFYSYNNPLDSSAITIDDWMNLAKIIKYLYKYYQGFVILHGTNTMAYTASALSFLFDNLNKPIILTGSEIPLVHLNSDAEHNFIRAVEVASPFPHRPQEVVNEVCILFGKFLLRGNRATKRHASEPSIAFDSPNVKPLGEFHVNRMDINLSELIKYKNISTDHKNLQMQFSMSKADILVMKIYPGMEISHFERAFENNNLKGIILETYGAGNAREDDEFLSQLKILIEKGIVIINLSQCYEGGVELKLYETNSKLFDIGVINGGDMTVEAAYCKLRYLLGRSEGQVNIEMDMIKKDMQIDLKREMTYSVYSLKYFSNKQKLEADPVFRGQIKRTEHFKFLHSEIDHVFLRIQGIKLKKVKSDTISIKIYFNNNNVRLEEQEEDIFYRIAQFSRSIDGGEVSHNIEVTEKIRHLIKLDGNPITMQVVSTNSIGLIFESLELSIFTKKH